MSLWIDIAGCIANATGEVFAVAEREAVSGGCINAAWRVSDGKRTCFVKISDPQNHAMFAAEAAGLAELARAGAVRVPQPICDGSNEQASWLVLEFIRFGARGDGRSLGQALAALHGVTAPMFGWQRDNTIGATPQINTPCSEWIEFWRERRLRFQLALAAKKGAPPSLLSQGERLVSDFPALLAGCPVKPSLLHGDLWGGNAGYDASGAPVIFDPAVYYGHCETDVAMTELFGGFDADFYAGYRDRLPLDPGYAVRKHLYNLYHVLNHYNLFGGGYARQAGDLIARLLAQV